MIRLAFDSIFHNHCNILCSYLTVPSTAGSVRPTSARPASALVSQQRSRPASAPVSQPRTASVRGRATPQGTDQPQKLQMHWLAWDTGDLEPPGLQRQCHKPWPTPEPPVLPGDRTTGYVARGQSRPASARGTPSIPGASPAQTPSPPQNQQQCMAAGTSTVTGKVCLWLCQGRSWFFHSLLSSSYKFCMN